MKKIKTIYFTPTKVLILSRCIFPKNHSIATALFLLLHMVTYAQQLTSTAGNDGENNSYSFSWSIGEIVVETLGNEMIDMNQGYNQPWIQTSPQPISNAMKQDTNSVYNFSKSTTESTTEAFLTINQLANYDQLLCYPNPMSQKLNIAINIFNEGKYDLKVYDDLGRIVYTAFSESYFKKGIYSFNINRLESNTHNNFVVLRSDKVNIVQKIIKID